MDWGKVFMLLQIVELSRGHGVGSALKNLHDQALSELAALTPQEDTAVDEEEPTEAENNPAPTEREEAVEDEEEETKDE
jgi:hypothetical protein